MTLRGGGAVPGKSMRHCLWVARIQSFLRPRHKIPRTRPKDPLEPSRANDLLHGLVSSW